jgi:hypothetical protein
MQGRGAVLLGELIEQLRETLAERQQVLAAIRTGRRGPFEFERNIWKVADLLAGGDSSDLGILETAFQQDNLT